MSKFRGPSGWHLKATDGVRGARREDADEFGSDLSVRIRAFGLGEDHSNSDVVPICRRPIPDDYIKEIKAKRSVVEVALQHFPVPGPMSDWQSILDFKADMHDKQWHFRRFLNSLATKKQTEAEIRDDIEWTLNEYTKAMKIHHLKAGTVSPRYTSYR